MSNITKDFDALKAMMDNYASYSFDLQKNVEDKLNDYRYEAGERQINAYTDTYYQSLYAAENRINKYKQQDAEKLAKKQAQINKKYDKQIAAAKTEAEKKALQERQSAELKAAEEKAKYVRGLDADHRAAKEQRDEEASAISKALKDGNLLDLSDSLKEAFSDGSGFSSLAAALSDFTASLNAEIESIAKRKSSIDTRLQGSKNSTVAGSYWDRISKDITGAAAISPLVKQSDIAEQVQSMVKQGISYNVEQRAFLATISDKIADTFNATNSSLLRLVRIQQQDSTAARLGMESALNSFLNNMYETTEYMGAIMDGIKSSLEEAEALMGTEEAAQFEYQVQKWMGSMYSVGMSQGSVQSIASALGKLASGDISGITSDGTGNLIVMSANNAGLSVADMLAEGLDDSSTNKLMTAMVQYLQGIYSETKDSNVVAQQYASVFGLSAADLKAMSNLSTTDVKNIASSGLSYSGMISQLNSMANSMYSRTSTGELLQNLKDNLTYTMAAGIANNPALYMIYEMAQMLDSTMNGIEFSTPLVMGTGLPQTFNVADLMSVGALSGSIISGVASMIGSSGNGGITGSGLLKAFGVGTGSSVQRGTGSGLITSGGMTYSNSGYVGNASSGDVYSKSMTDATDSANAQTVSAQEESNEATTTDINDNLLLIYQLLQDVVSGASSFKVDMGDTSAWTQAMSPTL